MRRTTRWLLRRALTAFVSVCALRGFRWTLSQDTTASGGLNRFSLYRDVWREDGKVCYGNSRSTFEVYVLIAGIKSQYAQIIVNNTLEWTEKHGARLCVWHHKLDASRTASWNKIAATLEALTCSEAKWALSLDADAVVQNMELGPNDMLRRIERQVGVDLFRTRSLFLSDDFGRNAKLNVINAGVYFMRVNEVTIYFLERVWNDFHGMSIFYRPPREEQAAMRRYFMNARKSFDDCAIILPHRIFNQFYKNSAVDDFVRHYAGFRPLDVAGKRMDKFAILAAELESQRTKKSFSTLASTQVVKVFGYPTRFDSVTMFAKLLLRLAPTRIQVFKSACPLHVATGLKSPISFT